jgi:hypothetical protein
MQDEKKDIKQLEAFFKYGVTNDAILSGRLKVLISELSWRLELPTWTKEELDIMSAKMETLIEVSDLLYDIQWHKENWKTKNKGLGQ